MKSLIKGFLIFVLSVFSSGCSTTFWFSRYTAEWYDLMDQYEKECNNHYRSYLNKVKEIRSKDPFLTFEDSVNLLCQEDIGSCSPPKKPDRFDFLERIGKPVVADHCEDFIQ